MKVSGNVIWQEAPEEDLEEQSFAIAVCAGPIDRVLKIWDGRTLIYDETEHPDDQGAWQIPGLHVRVYKGEEWQGVSPLISSFEGESNTPAFRGLAYVEFTGYPTPNGNIPTLDFLVATNAEETNPVLKVPGIHPWLFTFSADDTLIFGIEGELVHVVDVFSRTLLYSFPTVAPESINGITVDDDNNVYIYYDKDSAWWLSKYTQHGELIVTGQTTALYGFILTPKNPDHPYLYAQTLFGNLVIHDRNTLKAPSDPTANYDSYSPTELGGVGDIQSGAINDETGELYFVCHGGGEYLVKCDYTGPANSVAVDVSSYNQGTFFIRAFYIDETNEVVLNADGGTSVLFDGTTLAYITTLSFYILMSSQGAVDGYVYWANTGVSGILGNDGGVWQYDVHTREVIRLYIADDVSAMTYLGAIPLFFSLETNTFFTNDQFDTEDDINYIPIGRADFDGIPLSQIVTDICEICDLDSVELDVSELTDTVRGFLVESRTTGRSAIEPLMQGFFFDGVESDGLLKFIKRGKSATVGIAEAELAAYKNGSSRPQELTTTRQQELELPISIDHTYVDVDREWHDGTQLAMRYTPFSENKLSLNLPIAFTADEARAVAEKTLYLAWVDRDTFSASVSYKYSYLDPCDVITVSEGGNIHSLRIEKISSANGLLDMELRAEDVSIYSITSQGSSGDFPPTVIILVGTTHFIVLDIPLLFDAYAQLADLPGIYIVGTGFTEFWKGANVSFSLDTFPTTVALPDLQTGIIYGSASTALPGFQHNIIDRGNTVTVRLITPSASLSSITEAELLAGGNLCVIGKEVLHFQTATQSGDDWILSNLLRGRRGTELDELTHVIGDTFLLVTDDVELIKLPFAASALLDTTATFYATSIGSANSSSVTVDPVTLRALMPYSVVHPEASVPYTGAKDITVTWFRRTRLDGQWRDTSDIPLNEATEAYEVDIFDSGGTLLRTKTGLTSETAVYTVAEQTADGITWSVSTVLTFVIYQISAVVGRGVPTTLPIDSSIDPSM